jgi:uncharacterized damage-inducible protein DinB
MSVTIPLDELLDYSDHERRKWREWFSADVARLDIPMQIGGRFPTAAAMVDHVFLVERRHLARLEGGTPPESTGIPPGDIEDLFDYGALVRADLRRYVTDLDEAGAGETTAVATRAGTFTMARRALLTHIVLHEVRHFAQIAFGARLAGHPPPGEHDLFYYAGQQAGSG